jgi:hypothetical protein
MLNHRAPAAPYVPPPPPPIPDGFTRYENAAYHFALAYPSDLTPKEFDEGKGAETITFTGTTPADGFQIFITPYGDTQITSSRIALDTRNTASGIQQKTFTGGESQQISALTFSSKDPHGQPMQEVWFLHGHYLYEISTYEGTEEWFTQMLSTLEEK